MIQYIQKRHPRTFLTSSTSGSARNHPGRLSAITHGSKNRIAVHTAMALRWPCALLTTCCAAPHAPLTPAPSTALTNE